MMTNIVSEIDATTQKNAQMADQSSSSARSLATESSRLMNLISTFRLSETESQQDAAWEELSSQQSEGEAEQLVNF